MQCSSIVGLNFGVALQIPLKETILQLFVPYKFEWHLINCLCCLEQLLGKKLYGGTQY